VYLAQAIPELVTRLITPDCIDPATGTDYGPSTQDSSGSVVCAQGVLEFPAIHDMHIGVVSSSLGPRLGDQTSAGASGGACLPTATITIGGAVLQEHNDDQAHLTPRS